MSGVSRSGLGAAVTSLMSTMVMPFRGGFHMRNRFRSYAGRPLLHGPAAHRMRPHSARGTGVPQVVRSRTGLGALVGNSPGFSGSSVLAEESGPHTGAPHRITPAHRISSRHTTPHHIGRTTCPTPPSRSARSWNRRPPRSPRPPPTRPTSSTSARRGPQGRRRGAVRRDRQAGRRRGVDHRRGRPDRRVSGPGSSARPAPTGALPVILYIHGAGWVFGNAHTHDRLVRELAVGARRRRRLPRVRPLARGPLPGRHRAELRGRPVGRQRRRRPRTWTAPGSPSPVTRSAATWPPR